MIQRFIQKWKQVRRQRDFESQLVEGIGFMTNALRAGLSLPQAIELTSQDMSGVFATEMAAIFEQLQLGVALTDALQDSVRRFPITDWRMTVQAAVVLLESGGNLIESFQLILETVRDRQRVTEKIRTATTQGKAQAGIISAMPFGLAVMLMIVSPDYIAPLFTWPTGAGIITMGLLMLAGGVLWMRLILRIEV